MLCEDADPLLDAFADAGLAGESLVSGELEETQRTAVAAHLETCARCLRQVEESRRLSSSLAALQSVAPSAAADARVLAAVEEERAWGRVRARTRRVAAAIAATAAMAVAMAAVVVATPLGSWIAERAECVVHSAELWVRHRGSAEMDRVLPAILTAAAFVAVIVALDAVFTRWETRVRRA